MDSIELNYLFDTYGLKESDIYFLDLIPLVEMIWADGHNQREELRILSDFALDHMEELNEIVGAEVVTPADLKDFLRRYGEQRPPRGLLASLREIACRRLHRRSESQDKGQAVFMCCLDIAAACVDRYPYGMRQRIMERERQLLLALMPLLREQGMAGI
ncbi:MAG: hypothetical protein Kow0060_01750 [Methylohalobius crimeensis]